VLRECKPPPRRLTPADSEPGFESGFRFLISAGSFPNCYGLIMSAPVISPSIVKNSQYDCMRNAYKSNKILYSAMVREVQKWTGIRTRHRIITES